MSNQELEIIGYQPITGFDFPFRAVLNVKKDERRHWVLIGINGGRFIEAVPHIINTDRLVSEEQALALETNFSTWRTPKQVLSNMKRTVAAHNAGQSGIDFSAEHAY